MIYCCHDNFVTFGIAHEASVCLFFFPHRKRKCFTPVGLLIIPVPRDIGDKLNKDVAAKQITLERNQRGRPASAGFEAALVLQWMQPDAPDVLSVIVGVVRTIFAAVLCWNAAVEMQDAKRLIKKSRGCCWHTASHPGGGGRTEDAAENADYHGQHLPPPPRIPKHTGEQLQRQTDSNIRSRSLFLPAAIRIFHACNLCICP